MDPAIIKTFSPAATRMLRLDHAHVLAQYHKLRSDTPAWAQAAVCRNICTGLEIHAQLEEELFYPALRELEVQIPALDRSLEEHTRMRAQISRVRQLEGQPPEQRAALHDLITGVLHHVADEETQVFPAAEQLLGTQQLKELGARMTRLRFELARPRAAAMAMDSVLAAPMKSALFAAGTLLAGGFLFRQLRRSHLHRH